jgi:hypothetical protein
MKVSLQLATGMLSVKQEPSTLLPLLVMVFALISLTMNRGSIQPLSAISRRFAWLVLILGVLTPFLRLVTINSPAWGRREWSLVAIVSEIRSGNLPVDPRMAYFAETYVLVLVALVLLFFPSVPKLLVLVAMLGSISGGWAVYTVEATVLHTFYRHFDSKAVSTLSYGPALYILGMVMPALLLICVNEVS